MLWTIAVILVVLWLAGLVCAYTLGGFIHILLAIALAVIILNLIQAEGDYSGLTKHSQIAVRRRISDLGPFHCRRIIDRSSTLWCGASHECHTRPRPLLGHCEYGGGTNCSVPGSLCRSVARASATKACVCAAVFRPFGRPG